MPVYLPILLAEDEETDVLILRMALKKAGIVNPLVVMRDGQEAINYLSGDGPYADRTKNPLPGLMILDLKMPGKDGFHILEWLGTQPALRNLPAVVLSSSSHERDMQKAREMGARDYHVKPHSVAELALILQRLSADWLEPKDKAAC